MAISLKSIKLLTFIMETKRVFYQIINEFLNII
jgi:hypothetical protein